MKKSILITLILFASLGLASSAHADASLSGWAWSSTAGWLSFNSGDSNTGSTQGVYSVNISTTTGVFSGYAWSSNIGWISFNSVSPNDTGVCGSAATVDLNNGKVSGWAKAIAGGSGGWDGCIELSGTGHPSPDNSGNGGVTMSTTTGAFTGFAWGSTNVGWLSFAATTSIPAVSCSGCINNPVQPTTTFSASCSTTTASILTNPGSVSFLVIPSNGSAPYHFSWDNLDTFTSTGSTTSMYFSAMSSNPTITVVDSNASTTVATCPTITVSNPTSFTCTLSANPSQINSVGGGASTLNWTTSETPQSCSITSIPSGNSSGSLTTNTWSTNVTATTTFTLTCTDYSSNQCSSPITVNVPNIGYPPGPGGTGNILLGAYRTTTSASSTNLQIQVGQSAYLGWLNNPASGADPTGYSCSINATKSGSASYTGSLGSFSGNWPWTSETPSDPASNVSPLSNRLPGGKYSFQILCASTTNPSLTSNSNSINITVINPNSVEE